MNHTEEKARGHALGVGIGCMLHGIDVNTMTKCASFKSECEGNVEVQQMLCKSAKFCLAVAGMEDGPEYKLYSRIEAMEQPLTKVSHDLFMVPVTDALQDSFVKRANALSTLFNFVGTAKATAGNSMSSLLTASIGTGATLGALTWALNRDSQVDDVKISEKEEQAAHYRKIADDIRKRLKLEEEPKRKALGKKVESEVEGAYIL